MATKQWQRRARQARAEIDRQIAELKPEVERLEQTFAGMADAPDGERAKVREELAKRSDELAALEAV